MESRLTACPGLMMSDNEHTANNRSQPAEPILRPPALHPKPVPCPREQPAMKTHLASIWPGLLAAITLSVLFSAAPAHAHGQYPNMATAPASGILPTAATLNGNVSADSAPATAWFQWGTRLKLRQFHRPGHARPQPWAECRRREQWPYSVLAMGGAGGRKKERLG